MPFQLVAAYEVPLFGCTDGSLYRVPPGHSQIPTNPATALYVSASSRWVYVFMVRRMSRFDGLTALSEVEGL